MVAFPDLSKTYYNDILFPAFSSRLPDKNRVDIVDILKKYDLEEYDEYELLKKVKLDCLLILFILLIQINYKSRKGKFNY